MTITLTQAKTHLRVDISDEDSYITSLIAVAESYVADYMDTDVVVTADLTTASDHAKLLLIGHWYENRQAVVDGQMNEMPLAVEALLNPYRTPTLR